MWRGFSALQAGWCLREQPAQGGGRLIGLRKKVQLAVGFGLPNVAPPYLAAELNGYSWRTLMFRLSRQRPRESKTGPS